MSKQSFHRGRGGSRAKKPVLLIICEGETEKLYFKELKSEVRLASINIVIPKTKERDPLNLVNYARKISNENGYSIKDSDNVWIVFDMDDTKRVKKAIHEANKSKYNMALSIPSIELWYLLHYQYTTSIMDNMEVKSQLKRHLPNYKKTDPGVPLILCEKRGMALKNANKLLKHHSGDNHDLYSEEANPVTHVFKLVESIFKD